MKATSETTTEEVKRTLERRQDWTEIESVEDEGNGKFKITMDVPGGVCGFSTPTDKFRISGFTQLGDGETLTVRVVEKR
jgi:hypothetical protein